LSDHLREGDGIGEGGEPEVALRLSARNDVMQLAALEQTDVFGTRHAAIHHNGGASREIHTSGEAIEHGRERGDILSVAGKDLVADGKAFAPHHETNDHLLTVRTAVARMPAFGLGIGRGQALEIRRGQIVEIDALVEIEEAAFALDKLRLDGGAMRVECVKNTIQRILRQLVEIILEHIGQGRALNPSWHGILRCRLDQTVQRHGTRELPCSLGQLLIFEDFI
jgi:hypothetical protein